MRSRALCWVATLLLGLLLCTPRAQAQQQPTFDFIEPNPSPQAQDGSYLVRWKDNFFPNGFFNGRIYSITWYFATRKDGMDRRRIATVIRDDFGTFRQNWELPGAALAWGLLADPNERRTYLRAPDMAVGPAISRDTLPGDAVVSALIRPRGAQPQFCLGLRVGERGQPGIEIRHAQGTVQLVQGNAIIAAKQCPGLTANAWYWYEFGTRPKRNGDLEARLRIFNEDREQVVVDFDPVLIKFGARGGSRVGGPMAIGGPADFAEVYVDRWAARWADDNRNQFNWDTSQVPDGNYYIIAEISDGKKHIFSRTSNFQVQVANLDQAARE